MPVCLQPLKIAFFPGLLLFAPPVFCVPCSSCLRVFFLVRSGDTSSPRRSWSSPSAAAWNEPPPSTARWKPPPAAAAAWKEPPPAAARWEPPAASSPQ